DVQVVLPAVQRHIGKRAILRLPIEEVRPGERIAARSGFGLIQPDEAVRIAIRKRTKQESVNDAENRGIGPDAGGQGKGGDCRESARFQETPDGVTRVLEDGSHGYTSITLSVRLANSRSGCRRPIQLPLPYTIAALSGAECRHEPRP